MARTRSCDRPFTWPPVVQPACVRQLDHKPKPVALRTLELVFNEDGSFDEMRPVQQPKEVTINVRPKHAT
jgi:hypothetical protein